MQNRNVVSRARTAQPQVPTAARTIEFDCRAIAAVLDAQTATAAAPDLDAEIEVVATTSGHEARSAKDRFAHTLKRPGAALKSEGAALKIEGSQPMLPFAAPPVTAEAVEHGADNEEEVEPAAVTRAMAVVHEPALEVVHPIARARRWWLLPLAIVMFGGSVVALISVVM